MSFQEAFWLELTCILQISRTEWPIWALYTRPNCRVMIHGATVCLYILSARNLRTIILKFTIKHQTEAIHSPIGIGK